MKNVNYLLILLLSTTFNGHSQTNYTFLDHNNVSAYISDAGTFFVDVLTTEAGYEVPKGSGHDAIYSTQFWFAGKDVGGNIHFSQGGYPGSGRDVFNGPISGEGTYDTPEYQSQWGVSMWSICQADIDHYVTWWKCQNGIIVDDCELVSEPSMALINLLNSWPAHGDVSIGQSYFLAPFFDYDMDGVYSPADGDYPIIKGCCATYMIQNDAAESHSYSLSDSIGLEIHYMFYQYESVDYLNDATFVDVMAINRGNTNYLEFAHSIYVDADLGNYSDDYFGCDSTNSVMYFYNADNIDENNPPSLGYGIDPPALGIVSLEHSLTSSSYYGQAGGFSIQEKWNAMNGLQFSGAPWLNPLGEDTKFTFSGNPSSGTEWNETTAGNASGDRRALASFFNGPLNSGDTLFQSYAILYTRDGNHLENAEAIINLAAEVKNFYDAETEMPCTTETASIGSLSNERIALSPNPSRGYFEVTSAEKMLSLTIFNTQGQKVYDLPVVNSNFVKCDLSAESHGLYLMQVQTEKGISMTKLVLE